MSEKTYSLAEAERELQKRECARRGHYPDEHLATLADNVGQWICRCGEVKWRPIAYREAREQREAGG